MKQLIKVELHVTSNREGYIHAAFLYQVVSSYRTLHIVEETLTTFAFIHINLDSVRYCIQLFQILSLAILYSIVKHSLLHAILWH